MIRRLAEEGRTMVVATNELAFAREVSSSVAFVYDGMCEEIGEPAQVFDDPESIHCRRFLAAAFGSQRGAPDIGRRGRLLA